MELKDFLKAQDKLDTIIMDRLADKGRLISTQELLNSKLVALATEVGEFANEVASFKYWKQGHEINIEKMFEEYVDILFFMFSLANLLEMSARDIEEAYVKKWNKNIKRQENGY